MKIFRIQYLMIGLLLCFGCERLVEIDPPQDYLISKTVFETNETAISATTGMYATVMKSDFPIPYYLSFYSGLYGDDLDYDQTNVSVITVYKYGMNPQDAPTNPIWNNGFNYIYQANSIIEGLTNSSGVTETIKHQLMGEALFVRAFWYSYLANLYGPLPLILTTDYNKNKSLTRSSVDVIQKQIIDDLTAAKQLLSEKYVAANSTAESNDRIRPNTFVASALLARVYLWTKNFKGAEDEATRIIDNSKYSLAADLAMAFKRTSKEVIWQLELPSGSGFNNSYEATYFALASKPNSLGATRAATISSDLLSLFSSVDKRASFWIGTYVDNSVTPSVSYKYPSKLKSVSAPADEYSTPFRLAEMFLIRAEARAQQNNLTDAIADADQTRFRAGIDLLKDITPSISQDALLDSIGVEKRRELFGEWGIRWMDIRRSPEADDLMKTIAARKGAAWKSTAILWPIPLNEILNSGKKLEQNEGYN